MRIRQPKRRRSTTGIPSWLRLPRTALVSFLAVACVAINVAFHATSLHLFSHVDQHGSNSTSHQLLPSKATMQHYRRLKENMKKLDEKKAESSSFFEAPLADQPAATKKDEGFKRSIVFGEDKRQNVRNDLSSIVAKGLSKPIPAVMCVNPKCEVEACPEATDAGTLLPAFMKQFPAAHYGYGFVNRSLELRGGKMRTSGSAKSGSGCALSRKYKFLFIHVLKSGGTTMKGFLLEGLCGSTDVPCKHGKDNLEIVNCASAIRQYPDYFVFSFVRNPYSRMYSAYAMAHNFRDRKGTPQRPPFSFQEFVTGERMEGEIANETKRETHRQLLEIHNHHDHHPPHAAIPHLHSAGHLAKDRRHMEHHEQRRNAFRHHVSALQGAHGDGSTNIRTNFHNEIPWKAPVQNEHLKPFNPHHLRHDLQQYEDHRPMVEHREFDYHTRKPFQHPGRGMHGDAGGRSVLRAPRGRTKLSYLSPSHWTPQTNFLFSSSGGCPVVDFIGHLENMREDLRTVLTYIDSPELWEHFYAQTNQTAAKVKTDESTNFGARQKQKELGGNLQKAYQYEPSQKVWGPVQQAVYNEFKMDFDLLGYDPAMVPS